jgi:NitT/TauT family transport system permease protein
MVKRLLLGGLSITLLFLLWALYANHLDNPYILPGPIDVIKTFFQLITKGQTYVIIGISLFRLLIAFIFSMFLGVLMGLMAGNYLGIDAFLKPIISGLRTLPIASIIIIIIILLGRESSLYLITFLMIFPLIYEATKNGVLHIDQPLKDHIRIEHHPKWVLMTKIQLPLAFPLIKTSMFQSIGLGFKVIVMAEFISQARIGIGRELQEASISIEYVQVFAWTLVMIIIVVIFESLLKIYKAYDQQTS